MRGTSIKPDNATTNVLMQAITADVDAPGRTHAVTKTTSDAGARGVLQQGQQQNEAHQATHGHGAASDALHDALEVPAAADADARRRRSARGAYGERVEEQGDKCERTTSVATWAECGDKESGARGESPSKDDGAGYAADDGVGKIKSAGLGFDEMRRLEVDKMGKMSSTRDVNFDARDVERACDEHGAGGKDDGSGAPADDEGHDVTKHEDIGVEGAARRQPRGKASWASV